MKKETLIFIGRSGSGKGTQVNLLKEYIQKKYPETEILHFESGANFRKLIKEEGYTNDVIRDFIQKGELVPNFITEWMLTDFMIQNFNGNQFLIFDGFPRTLQQSQTMNDIIHYYKLENVKIIDVYVSGDEVRKRMLSRGRDDDNLDLINKRIEWYDVNVLPALAYFKRNEAVEYIHINGEQDIEEVFQEIITKLNY